MASNPNISRQASLYVFDLNNSAKEYWFKADDEWEFAQGSTKEKIAFERKYHPTISTKVLPESLQELFNSVKGKLKQVNCRLGSMPDMNNHSEKEPFYLMAFNAGRMR